METEIDSVMDLLVVLERKNVTHPTNVLAKNVVTQFGKDTKFKMFEDCFVLEFTTKTRALKALEDGLQIGNGLPLELYTMEQYLAFRNP